MGAEEEHADRILPVDKEAAQISGELTGAAQNRGKPVAAADGLIAAIAIRHGLHLMTRNTGGFEATGALLLFPWEGS